MPYFLPPHLFYFLLVVLTYPSTPTPFSSIVTYLVPLETVNTPSCLAQNSYATCTVVGSESCGSATNTSSIYYLLKQRCNDYCFQYYCLFYSAICTDTSNISTTAGPILPYHPDSPKSFTAGAIMVIVIITIIPAAFVIFLVVFIVKKVRESRLQRMREYGGPRAPAYRTTAQPRYVVIPQVRSGVKVAATS